MSDRGKPFRNVRNHLEEHRSSVIPRYVDGAMDPYRLAVGWDEQDDPLSYAASLIRQILETPRQEVGSYTFSQYLCEAPGRTVEAFRADLQSATAMACDMDVEIRSLLFPRNQVNPAYLPVLRELGILTYRGRDPLCL